ncbi:tetratricopeptide repeat protein [Pseudalkalibacillus decolorationis]|uniref:tetratricopeptide repeat protein n=1 Tax=Pseudalkalibacillus decolorationis TaxID=163879 RepID=UPI0021475DA5|nr:tetratricopeptide repeat protein [Pseudalkalibacillus decolorationis]
MKANKSMMHQGANVIPFARTGEYFFQKGLKSYQKKDLYKAQRLFERAVDLEPKDPTYLCQLAATHAELGDYIESNDILEYIVSEIDPEISECYYFMANNYAHLNMFREAEREAVRYMEHEPNGEFYDDIEELLDLIQLEFGEDSENDPSEERLIVKHEKARHSLEKGDFSKARDILKAMVLEHPDFWAAYNNLALAHFYLGEYDEAFLVLEDVLDKNIGNLHALCNAALFHKQLHENEECERFLRILHTIHPISPEHRYKLGSTFALLGEDEAAYKWLYSIKKFGNAWNTPYFHWLAVAAFKMGKKELARESWEKLSVLDPESSVASFYLEQLEHELLDPGEVEYQYTIPMGNLQDPEEISDRILKLRSTIHKNKLSHLLLLRKWRDEDAFATLKSFCTEPKESEVMKELAATMLFELGNEKVEVHSEEGLEEVVKPSTEMRNGLQILEHLIAGRQELDAETALLWHLLLHKTKSETHTLTNTNAWSSAISYFADVLKGKTETTQREVAEQYGVSITTVQKYVKIIKTYYSQVK